MSLNTIAPICIFSYNRPNHLRRVLDALSKNDLASESILYIYCDGAKPLQTEEDKAFDKETTSARRFFKGTETEYKKYLTDIEDNIKVAQSATGFKEVNIIIRPQNVGLKDNIVGAVTEVVNQYGRVITLEDDIITSKGFLRYMNDALEVYKDEEKVMHISAYMWPHRWRLPETFFHPIPYPGGGWATWKRAWKYYNDNTQELYDYWKDKWDVFNTNGGVFYQRQLEDNLSGKLSTWFIKWHAVMLQRNGLTLFPSRSLTTNIGFDGSATNCKTTNKYYINKLVKEIKVDKKNIVINKRGASEIYSFYQGRWYNKRRRKKLINDIVNKIAFWK